MKLSPMMQQYMDIHEEYPDSILFFRLGDFYEMFFDDAILVSRLLELTLTGKACGLEEKAPMCGIPFHAADTYIVKLVEMGYKVAVCEQLEDPAHTKGMVKRGVIRVVTPGTVTSEAVLNERENNYLAAAYLDQNGMSVTYCDISTGELCTTEKRYGSALYEDMLNELVRISPKEILISQSLADAHDEKKMGNLTGGYIRVLPDSYFSENAARDAVRAQFGSVSLTALGLDGRDCCLLSLGTLLAFLLETQMQDLKQITECRFYEIGSAMALDRSTIRNLEITETLYEKKKQGSLLGVLDRTRTAMGARLMKQMLREPLNDAAAINRRLDAVEALVNDPLTRNDLTEALKQVYDFERLAGRIASGNANGKDMIALRNSVRVLPEVKACLSGLPGELLSTLARDMEDLHEVQEMITRAIVEEPPMTVKEGGIIRPGYSKELDELELSIRDAKTWIAGLEAQEKERTGISHLKVGFNKVFGYYIEVSRSNLDMVPDNYIRKQTLVGGERFVTPELKETEGLVLNSEAKINQLEYDLFTELRGKIQAFIGLIQRTSRAIAMTDVLNAFAAVSDQLNYNRPVVNDGMEIVIDKGRHPVIEQMTEDGMFVSNDTRMNDKDSSMLIITGPNMSGKSTYMRQTALIVLMAQVGCFVPAERAEIGVVDRIFTRIGASDNLAQGQSTFFVEMSELAYILRNARERSLIILDEIGRGTSTYDGLSIAWAAVEYLCCRERHIRTLFATHYHELTVLEEKLEGVRNLSVDVSEENGDIIFLHRIVAGSASRSYGIHVAKLAGVPLVLLENARSKLARLEEESRTEEVRDAMTDEAAGEKEPREQQMSLFTETINPAVERLKNLDLMNLTPSQAIRELEDLQELIREQ